MLTYDNPIFGDKIKDIIIDNNLYIHAKYPDKLNNFFKKYLIKKQIETSWGDFSLVDATINLLEAASNDNNDYYILLSGDTYPLYNKNQFDTLFNKKIINNLSIFDYIGQYNDIYKSSQWFILNNIDTNIIINTRNKYKYLFDNINKVIGAPDELYFLTVLNKENNKYKYTTDKILYTRWLKNVIVKHPIYFNKLTENDLVDIAKNGSLFIRKCFDTFNLNKYIPNNKLFIIYIGSETNQKDILNINFNLIDIIILTSIDISLINRDIIDKCIYLYKIIWKFHKDVMIDMCISHRHIINQWKEILFTTEKFNFKNIKELNETKRFKLKNNSKYIMNVKILIDDNYNQGYKLN